MAAPNHHRREVPIFTRERLSKASSSCHPPLQPLPPSPQQQTPNVLVDDEQHNKHPPDSDSDWVISITGKLEACHDDVATTFAKQCIFKVPHYLREGNDRSYVPQIVGIGPYHHVKDPSRIINGHKWRSLKQMLKRTNHDVKRYLNGLKEIEVKIRACYEGPIIGFAGSDEFVEMMLLDGCFILELFQGAKEGFEKLGYAIHDPIFSMRGSMHTIRRDLIMLENQLPLSVLDLLYSIQLEQPEQKGLVSKLSLMFFEPLSPTDMTELWLPNFDSLSDQDSLHCLQVFRRGLILRRSNSNHVADNRGQQQWIPCATALRDAGFKFQRRRTDRFWDVEYKNRILNIPSLLIHDGTKSLFLNLIAFEQCHLDCSSDITSYVIFMDNLINSPEDVGYLRDCGIIKHGLGKDAEVADLFNHLGQQVVFESRNSYLSTLSNEVHNDFNYSWSKFRAMMKRNCFGSSPEAIMSSVFFAFILLMLTFTQTIYTVSGYFRPSGK